MKTSYHPLLLVSLFFIIVLAILHFAALIFLFYWRFAWFDNLMHVLGGVWLASSLIWLTNFSPYKITLSLRGESELTTILIGVLTISVFWEVFEYVLGVTYAERYLVDTAADLFFGLAGATAAWFILKRLGFLKLP